MAARTSGWRNTFVLAVAIVTGCQSAGSPPDATMATPPAPSTPVLSPAKTYPAECSLPYWERDELIVEVRGSRDAITATLRRFLRNTPDHGAARDTGEMWKTSGSVSESELASLRSFCAREKCEVTVGIDKVAYADRLYRVYCDREPRR